MKWNNIEDTSGINKLAWGSSVVIAPILINAFFENKDKLKIDPDSVSNLEEFKKTNNQTKVFLSIALALTFGVGAKLIHRIYTCKGGMTKPMIIQMVIIGIASGLFLLVNKDKKENFGSSTEELGEHFEFLFKTKHINVNYQWKEKDKFLKQIKKEDFKTYDEISNGFDTFRLNQFKIDLENRRKRVNEYFKDKTTADNYFTSNKPYTNVRIAYEIINLDSEADWPKLWEKTKGDYKNMEAWLEQGGGWEKYEKEGRPIPGNDVRLFKKLLMNNDGSMVKLSKDTVPPEDIRKKWIFVLVMSKLFNYSNKDVILNSTEFNTYDKIKGNFKYLYYYRHIIRAYHDNIDNKHPMGFLIKKFDPNQPVDEVANFYKIKNPPSTNHQAQKYKTQLPFTQRLVHDIHKKSGIYSNDDWNFKKHKIPSDYTPKIESYKQLLYYANKLHEEFLKKYPTEPTLEDVKNHETVNSNSDMCKPFKYSEKEDYIKYYMEPRNCSLNETIAVSKDSKEKMNKSWVIAFLLILSSTVCRKDTIDYIIEGSLWGYLIQNTARLNDISPNLF